jgi:hypothetical protein
MPKLFMDLSLLSKISHKLVHHFLMYKITVMIKPIIYNP